MRILHVSRTMGQGGAEKIVFQLCRDNIKQEQMVVSCGGTYVGELEEIGIKHYMMPDLDRKKISAILGCFFAIWRVVKKEKIDIIHSHHRMAAFYARIISILTGAKTIYTAHNVFYDKAKLTRFSLKGSCIVAVGDGVKRNLIDYFGIDERRIMTIYNSIPIAETLESEPCFDGLRELGKGLVGTIGRITEQKGMDIFVNAIAECNIKGLNIVGIIIGDGEDKGELEEVVKEKNLDNDILFLGFRKNVPSIIRQLDFVVLASRWEGLPLVPIEVFYQGKKIIASKI